MSMMLLLDRKSTGGLPERTGGLPEVTGGLPERTGGLLGLIYVILSIVCAIYFN